MDGGSSDEYSWSDGGSSDGGEETETDAAAAMLKVEGYVVFRLVEDVAPHVARFDRALRNLREYVGGDGRQYAKTGFGGLATPSSFHNETVRYLRMMAYRRVVPVLAAYDRLQTHGFCGTRDRPWDAAVRVARPRATNGVLRPRRVHHVVDRMATRVRGQQPGAEAWHRDVAYTGTDDAVTVFGGWLALTDQTASLVPRTHEALPGAVGFSAVPKAQHAEMRRRAVAVPVPAGWVLLMHQNIVHEVVAKKHDSDDPMRRLFMGWRLTYSRTPLCEHSIPRTGHDTKMGSRRDGPAFSQNLDAALHNQEAFKLPSDQFPDVYNEKGLDMPAQQPGLRAWLATYLHPNLFQPIYSAEGAIKFRGGAPLRHMLPMAHYQEGAQRGATNVRVVAAATGRAPYPSYSGVERAMLRPLRMAAALRLAEALDEGPLREAAGAAGASGGEGL